MKHLKRIGLLLLAAAILGIYGCRTSSTGKAQEKVVLTARQKSILAERNLPTEYDELRYSQQRAIVAIERMLQYAEAKYKIPMKYAGYVPYTPGVEWEHLYAYPESGHEEIDCFEVTKRNERYEDNYVEVCSVGKYTDYVKSLILKDYPETAIKVHAKIKRASLNGVPDSGSAFDGTTAAIVWVFLDDAVFTEEAYRDFIKQAENSLKAHKLTTAVRFLLMKSEDMKHITRASYERYFSPDHFLIREIIYIEFPKDEGDSE